MRREALGDGLTIIVDIGKTLSKVSLWSADGRLRDRKVRPNAPIEVDGIRRLDLPGITAFVEECLSSHAGLPVEAIIPVSHGAAVVALDGDRLALPPLDYEHALPDDVLADYRQQRGDFAETGSPALPDGLNFGAQLHWLERRHPEIMARATLMPLAQYWAWQLTGVAVSEVSSLGCHSDLWSPSAASFSALAVRRGWDRRFAPLAHASAVVGTLKADIAARTVLPETVQVHAGLHDSNAALMAARGFPAIAGHEATLLSTGTWFIAMRLPATPVDCTTLPEARDCLVNVDPDGRPVPSARFMGGREIERIIEDAAHQIDIKADQPALLAAVPRLLKQGIMLLPTLAPGCGPFPDGEARWIGTPADWTEKRAAAGLYAALVADASLDLIGAGDRLLIEGRFAQADIFVRALATLRAGTEVYTADAETDVAFGALRLRYPALQATGDLKRVTPLEGSLDAYRAQWRAQIGGGTE